MSRDRNASPAPQVRKRRAPVQVTHKRTPQAREFDWATRLVDGLGQGFHSALQDAIGEGRGRPASITGRHVLIAWALLVTEQGHRAEVTDAVGQLLALSHSQRERIGLGVIPPERAYKRFHDKLTRVRNAFAEGFDYPDDGCTFSADLDWWTTTLPRQAIPTDLPSSTTCAVDGTDWESAGRFRSNRSVEYDGDAPADTDDDLRHHDDQVQKTRTKAAKKAQWPIGDDGRAVYTTDPDARAGYRTTTAGRPGGMYIGHEIHLLVQTRDFSWNGDVTRVVEGPDVPSFVTGASLSPAGTHRAKAVVPVITDPRQCASKIVWDRGYSILGFETAHGPLLDAGKQAVFDLSATQRRNPPVSQGVIWLDGHPFHEHTPEHLRTLERPPMGSTAQERAAYEADFNERAAWRYTRHAGPDQDGYTRWKCPFCSGRLKCRSIRQKKVQAGARLVTLPPKVKQCCQGILTIDATYLNLVQAFAIPYGTTAHAQAYGRRNLVESGNSYLGGTYVKLDRTYSRLMGNRNRKFLLGMLLAGLNRYIEGSWRASVAATQAAAQTVKTRAKRRDQSRTLSGTVRPQSQRPPKRSSKAHAARHPSTT